VSDLTNALLEEWSKIPINALLNLVESLPRRVEAKATVYICELIVLFIPPALSEISNHCF